MATLTIDLPETLLTELHQREISDELLQSLIVRTIEALVQAEPVVSAEKIEQWLDATTPAVTGSQSQPSPFAQSALPFIEQLLDENLALFERLAKL